VNRIDISDCAAVPDPGQIIDSRTNRLTKAGIPWRCLAWFIGSLSMWVELGLTLWLSVKPGTAILIILAGQGLQHAKGHKRPFQQALSVAKADAEVPGCLDRIVIEWNKLGAGDCIDQWNSFYGWWGKSDHVPKFSFFDKPDCGTTKTQGQ